MQHQRVQVRMRVAAVEEKRWQSKKSNLLHFHRLILLSLQPTILLLAFSMPPNWMVHFFQLIRPALFQFHLLQLLHRRSLLYRHYHLMNQQRNSTVQTHGANNSGAFNSPAKNTPRTGRMSIAPGSNTGGDASASSSAFSSPAALLLLQLLDHVVTR